MSTTVYISSVHTYTPHIPLYILSTYNLLYITYHTLDTIHYIRTTIYTQLPIIHYTLIHTIYYIHYILCTISIRRIMGRKFVVAIPQLRWEGTK